MLRTRHQLACLHFAELRERAVGGFVTPDALAGREHRIAAIALFVVAVVLIAVDDDLVAGLPALHLGAHSPDDARRVGACDVIGLLVPIERAERLAECGPDAIIVYAGRHHEHEHFVLTDRRHRHLLQLHRRRRAAVPLLANSPRPHLFGHVILRRNLANGVNVFDRLQSGLRHWLAPLHIDKKRFLLHCVNCLPRRTMRGFR